LAFAVRLFDAIGAAKNPFSALNASDVGTAEKQRLALEAARQAIVLLKNTATTRNTATTLPLKPGLGAVALIGPCLEVRDGGYSKGGSAGKYTGTAAAAISSYAGTDALERVWRCCFNARNVKITPVFSQVL
jgi:beta-glucosidase-like glycosyl hydrolase